MERPVWPQGSQSSPLQMGGIDVQVVLLEGGAPRRRRIHRPVQNKSTHPSGGPFHRALFNMPSWGSAFPGGVVPSMRKHRSTCRPPHSHPYFSIKNFSLTICTQNGGASSATPRLCMGKWKGLCGLRARRARPSKWVSPRDMTRLLTTAQCLPTVTAPMELNLGGVAQLVRAAES